MSILNSLFFTLFCSAFIGSALRIGLVYPLRVVLPLALIFSAITYLSQKNTRSKPSSLMKYMLFYLFLFYVFTLSSSIMGYVTLHVYPDMNDLFNFTILFLLLLSVWLYSVVSNNFFKIFTSSVLVMYFVYLLISIIEITTGFHFSDSVSNELKLNIPTVFFVNPNDFASIFTLMLMYLMTIYKNRFQWLQFTIIIIHLGVIFYTGSRLSILVLMCFLLFRLKTVLKYGIIFGGILLLFYSSFILDFSQQIIGFVDALSSFTDTSSGVRLELYKESLHSAIASFGLGFGVNSSQAYLESLNNPAFLGIVNPHSSILELLINSGIIVVLAFLILKLYIFYVLIKEREFEKSAHLFFYTIILFSSSSSLFLWSSYLFLMLYVNWAENKIVKSVNA